MARPDGEGTPGGVRSCERPEESGRHGRHFRVQRGHVIPLCPKAGRLYADDDFTSKE